MLQFTSVSIESSFMKTRRVEGRETLLAWKVNKACQSSSHLKFHNRERGGMFQVRIMLELRFFTSEILHLNGLV